MDARVKFNINDWVDNVKTPVETRDKRQVTLYTVNRQSEYPILGDIIEANGDVVSGYWLNEGDYGEKLEKESSHPSDLFFKNGRRWTNGELSSWLRGGKDREVLNTSTKIVSTQFDYHIDSEFDSCPEDLMVRTNKGDWTEPVDIKRITMGNINRTVLYTLGRDENGDITITFQSIISKNKDEYYIILLLEKLSLCEFIREFEADPDYVGKMINNSFIINQHRPTCLESLERKVSESTIEKLSEEEGVKYVDFADLSDKDLVDSLLEGVGRYDQTGLLMSLINSKIIYNFKR